MAEVPRWTEPDAVVTLLRRRWKSGELLSAHVGLSRWDPIAVPITGPRAAEITGAFDEVRAWVGRWSAAEAKRRFRLESRSVGGRLVGQNALPARAHVETLDDAWVLLGVRRDVGVYDGLLAQTPDGPLSRWARENPMKVLEHAEVWANLLSAVAWIESRGGQGHYLRQIDAPGVDTKFVERHKGILARLLDGILPAERIVASAPPSAFERRYGFAAKPDYIRWRSLDPVDQEGPFSEMSVRADEFALAPPAASHVVVIENEITYLALPPHEDTIAIFGAGFGARRLRGLDWLTDRDVIYWGDIDTHGFAILDQMRSMFPRVRSMLMDRATLLAHRAHWTREPANTRAELASLSSAESRLYVELIEDVHGANVRLEQERVRFSLVEEALRTSLSP